MATASLFNIDRARDWRLSSLESFICLLRECHLICKNPAPGGPGIEPRWTGGAKDGVGTAYSVSSRLWYTIANGVNTEVYYPTIDTPQIRDLQFLISDEETFFHDERRNTVSKIELIDPNALGFKITNAIPKAATRSKNRSSAIRT